MPKTILITINNSGGDIGPYDLTLIDGLNNETSWSSNPVSKAQLLAGYQMTVPDNIVKVKVQSENCTTFVELTIPTTQCPCRMYSYTNGIYRFNQCGQTSQTVLNIGLGSVIYCTDTNQPIIKVSGAGSFADTGVCCSPGTPPTIPTTTTSTTTTSTSTTSTTSTTTTTTASPGPTTTTTTAYPTSYRVGVYIKNQSTSTDHISILYSFNNGATWTLWIADTQGSNTLNYNVYGGLAVNQGQSIAIAIVKQTNGADIRFGQGQFSSDFTSFCGKATPIAFTNVQGPINMYLNLAISSNSLVTC